MYRYPRAYRQGEKAQERGMGNFNVLRSVLVRSFITGATET